MVLTDIGAGVATGSELAGWANMVALLVGGGAVGGLVTAWMQDWARRREQWRTRLLAAADEFSQSFWLVYQQLWALLDLVNRRRGELPDQIDLEADEARMLSEAEPFLRDVLARLSRVVLLFGPDSPAAVAARSTRDNAKRAYNALDPLPEYPFADSGRARSHLGDAEAAHDQFLDAARSWAIRGKTRRSFPLFSRTRR